MLKVGLPSGGEFALLFLYTSISYFAIRQFGASAQAGFGIGSRILQAIMLPAMAIAFAAAPIAGQNYAANRPDRVRETFRQAALIGTAGMIAVTIFAQWQPQYFVGLFTSEPQALAIGTLFLRLISWNFVAQGLIFACSSMFQGLGNTLPSLLSSFARLTTYAIPALWLSTRPGFRIQYLWYLSIATVTLQALVSVLLLQREFKRRLVPLTVTPSAERAA
jgi:Na+-driven multidrug efflux pump